MTGQRLSFGRLVRADLRHNSASFAGVAVAIFVASALVTGLGVLVESGIRGEGCGTVEAGGVHGGGEGQCAHGVNATARPVAAAPGRGVVSSRARPAAALRTARGTLG